MPSIGVKDLKNHTTEIVRAVREERAEYIVTYHGRPVAVLLPIDAAWVQEAQARAAQTAQPGPELLAELEALRREIEESWCSDKSGVELIGEGRR